MDLWGRLRVAMRELRDYDGLLMMLAWDQAVMMPGRATEGRARQIGLVSTLRHARITDPEIGELLEQVAAEPLEARPAAAVARLKRERDLAVKIPAQLVEQVAEATSQGYAAWKGARRTNDFAALAPFLERIVELKRQEAEAIGYAGEPYDALLDLFDEGSTVATVEPTLRSVGEELKPLFDASLAAGMEGADLPRGPFDGAAQVNFSRDLAVRLGYDLEGGRVDPTPHPFVSTPGPGDVRLTTRYFDDDVLPCIMATMHESGHALYEQGLPADWFDTYAGLAASYALHESQSRLWENHVGRSRAFWDGQAPHLERAFPQLRGTTGEQFHRASCRVSRSLIRVESDELSYPFHIILRFDLELALIRGDLKVRDLPGAFNAEMRRHLGTSAETDSMGVLQDVHWSKGLFGYFPSYLLGTIYAAAIYAAAETALGGPASLDADIRDGDFSRLLGWLRPNIHARASFATTREILHDATGMRPEGPVDTAPFLRHLRSRYGSLYRIDADSLPVR